MKAKRFVTGIDSRKDLAAFWIFPKSDTHYKNQEESVSIPSIK